MYYHFQKVYYWPHLAAVVAGTVRNCSRCARNRVTLRRHTSYLKLFTSTKPVVDGILSQQPVQPQREGQVVLRGTLDREATKETPVDGVSVMKNPMLGRRSLVFPKLWQPRCRL